MWDIISEAFAEIWTQIGMKLLAAILILAVGLRLANYMGRKITSGKNFSRMDESVQSFMRSFIRAILYMLVIFTAAYCIGIPMTSFITVLASAGVAIGLALQGALSNFAGGLMILIFKPFEVGDYIEASGYAGTVQAITIFYTIIRTYDYKRITLPNGNLTGEAVVNHSSEGTRRLDMDFRISYTEETDLVKEIILSQIITDPRALDEPSPPFVRLTSLEDDCMLFTVRVFCLYSDYWEFKYDLTERIKKALDAAQIEISLPKLDVSIHEKGLPES